MTTPHPVASLASATPLFLALAVGCLATPASAACESGRDRLNAHVARQNAFVESCRRAAILRRDAPVPAASAIPVMVARPLPRTVSSAPARPQFAPLRAVGGQVATAPPAAAPAAQPAVPAEQASATP